MKIKTLQSSDCKDVFNAFLVKNATYSGKYEFPRIKPIYDIPNRIISFSKSLSCKDYNQWIHFYEYDYLFERIWKNPKRYLGVLQRYNGVILPDFSLYRDMPLSMQIWNIYRSRAIGSWLQLNEIKVIPNIRFGDKRTYAICCDGIQKHSVIAVGTHGNLKSENNRKVFLEGFNEVILKLQPSTVIVYGSLPQKYFNKYISEGIKIVHFESDIALIHKEKK